jgi:hypothetical protein
MRALRGEPTKPVLELKTSKSESTAKSKSTEREGRDRSSDATTTLMDATEMKPSKRLGRVCLGGGKRRVIREVPAGYVTSRSCFGVSVVAARRPSAW